jgi:thiol-disulfide isomerase/thioredoxin
MNKAYKSVFVISFLVSWLTLECFAMVVSNKQLLFFYSDRCGPCRIAHKEINNPHSLVSMAMKKYKLKKINFDIDKAKVSKYNIEQIPTFIILDNDKEMARLVGIKNGISDMVAFLLDNE